MGTGQYTLRRRRVAVIGSGVAGLTAAHILHRDDDVTLLEADDRLGGHAHTHRIADGGDGELWVDSGFIVHNRQTYPHLLRLFDELGVRTRPTEMSMSVSCDGCGLEYAGARGMRAMLPNRSRRSPAYLRMLAEIPRFHRAARRLLASGEDGAATGQQAPGPAGAAEPGAAPRRARAAADEPTLGEFVREHRFSPYMTAHFLLPLVSAVWSCPPGTATDYPARYLFAFLANHGMLGVWGSPRWRTVEGGSRSYVERVAKNLHAVRTGSPVRSLARTAKGVRVRTPTDTLDFDAAVVATHADQALALLDAPTDTEREVLGAFGYSRNRTLLHTDASVLPRDRTTWASWNHRLASCEPDRDPVRVSYHMNRLQNLDAADQYVVTLNGDDRVDPGRVVAAMDYTHPVYTPASLAAQRRLPELDDGVVAFAGAHHGWGFHEDGCASGVRAAASLGSLW
ncbi:FAD-dependent oxidoreductase [Nocardiopsis sp. CT-R113]|uniref:FAD-dependent oxidoreductase n=1 Tax=Nocardiopsis codii TaxID=3065942 RepID=A0ABU7K966_9ACTN|nr:FAD-dependent oxidoreductase [Nocardiopsis sp. CT-R113]MEE2038097.1 FAD-dependent oxidoreductase [Nocardiopsis sp. CT-R113]